MEEEYIPQKALYQIYIVKKDTEQVVLNKQVVAFNEGEALRKIPAANALIQHGLGPAGVDLYIRVIGCLYEGVFDNELSQ